MKRITEDEFWEKYKPKLNHFYNDENATSFNGCMYETYGEELEYVKDVAKKNLLNVWTIIDDGDTSTITSGFHYVNRMGFLITEIPCDEPDGVIDVYDDDFDEEE